MSSSTHILKFDSPLYGLHCAAAAGRAAVAPMPVHPDVKKLAAERSGLATRETELARRESELAVREAALALQAAELEDRKQLVETNASELGALIESARVEKAELLESSEADIISLSLSITERVLQHEVENGHYKISEVVRGTLRAVRDHGNVVVRVNPRDLELAQAAVEDMGRTFGTTRIHSVPDESIPPASCCMETDSGKVFSEIPGRLERIEHTLLKNGRNGGV